MEDIAKQEKGFEGFKPPTKNYFHMPNEWVDICAEIDNLAELKVIQYVLRHTWGYQEYGIAKAITVDEFMYGRKRIDGTRMDKGTGLKSDRSVKDGVKLAIQHGYIECDVDDSDKARIKKSYKLKMVANLEGYNLPPTEDTRGVQSTPQEGSIYPSEVQNLPLGGAKSTPRTEKDTVERHFEKDTVEKAVSSQPAATSQTYSLTQQELAFWQLWLASSVNKDSLRQINVTESAYNHIKRLAPLGFTAEQLESLIAFSQARLNASDKKNKHVYLGNLVGDYGDWKQSQKEPTPFPTNGVKPSPVPGYKSAKEINKKGDRFLPTQEMRA